MATALMDHQVESNRRPLRRSDLVIHELDGEALIFDQTTSDTHRLNSTALAIWRLCDGRHDADDIARALIEVYDVSKDAAARHVERLLESFLHLGLISGTNGKRG